MPSAAAILEEELCCYFLSEAFTLFCGDALQVLRQFQDESVDCVVTSPPYWGMRDYGIEGQLGQESPDLYIARLVDVFTEVRRALKPAGTVWLNLGDTYAGTKRDARGRCASGGLRPTNLMMIPARVALALQSDGWTLRSDVIWHKPNAMPDSGGRYRPGSSHEHIFMFVKSERYFYDYETVKEPAKWERWGDQTTPKYGSRSAGTRGAMMKERTKAEIEERYASKKRYRRDVWSVPTANFPGLHFAVFPPKLIEPCILAGCPEGGVVLDPYLGSGTTALVALEHGRKCVGIELSPEYSALAVERVSATIVP